MVGITGNQLGGVIGKPRRAGESDGVKPGQRARSTGGGMVALLSNAEKETTTGAGGQDRGR
ncbi:hypothetical protein SVIO_058590 [Streptomyces violaceusniger]|uniref:Uncharacterized protein n=1 Tax=Streptomyces violaceusniger TaxID=68280 RepID=A0A4D4L7R9_STRVO|nr:hypothetical protein SVIO_058590 [Streptomyces violaceusniger]